MKLRTKAELLGQMAAVRACQEARRYVASYPSDSARAIGLACSRPEWLVWFMSANVLSADLTAKLRTVAFAAADRTVRQYLPLLLSADGRSDLISELCDALSPVTDEDSAARAAWALRACPDLPSLFVQRTVSELRTTLEGSRSRWFPSVACETARSLAPCHREAGLQLAALESLWAEITS